MGHESRPDEVSRRTFLGSTAAAALAAPFAAKAAGANDKIAVGMIGLGIRGSQLLERLYAGNKETAAVVAVCDAYTGNLSKACARIATLGGNTPKQYADYRDLLHDKSIDAVIITVDWQQAGQSFNARARSLFRCAERSRGEIQRLG